MRASFGRKVAPSTAAKPTTIPSSAIAGNSTGSPGAGDLTAAQPKLALINSSANSTTVAKIVPRTVIRSAVAVCQGLIGPSSIGGCQPASAGGGDHVAPS